VAFGTDLVGAPQIFAGESREFGARLRWFSSAEILSQATAINGDLLALSGSRNLYGRLGVVEVGALADLLIVDGNPLEDIRVLETPESTLRVIVKDGRVVKQTL
jgi:imidazolonepropionase-like amidohydrolase